MITTLRQAIGRFRRREDGVVTVEFVLIFPVVLFLFFWAIELGMIITKQVILEHALDVTMRDLRLGQIQNPSSDTLRSTICARAKILSNCNGTMMIELAPVDTQTWNIPAGRVQCRNRDEEIQPVVTYNPGAQNQIMIVRACVLVEPLFPGTGLGALLPKDSLGGFAMAATSAFVNEPS